MACRSVLAIGPWRAAPVDDAANGGFHDARALLEAVTRASFDTFGPAAWHPLPMPGWR